MSLENAGFQTTHPSAPSGASSAAQAHELVLVYPAGLAGQRFELRPDLTFGRSPDATVATLLHETVSRRHAVVQRGLGGVLFLRDLGSRNGTRVNGARVTAPVALAPNAVVRLGDVLGIVDEPSARGFDADPVFRGSSAAMARAREQLERSASDPAPVLILGETGAGKERVAYEVHRVSGRTGPYVTLNCAELTAELVESQLFGHERGAFTGAQTAKSGLFVAADRGTLFLDEIGELPLDLQPKLLRVLETGEVRPLGSVRTHRVDVRVVGATHRALSDMVEHGQFRRDLHARLAYWEVRLPPLRERRRDLLAWLAFLLGVWNGERGTHARLELLPDAAEAILLHAWPDNLRGLSRLVHRVAGVAGSSEVGLDTLARAMPEVLAPPHGALPSSSSPPEQAASDVEAARESGGALTSRARPARDELLAVYEALGRSVRATAKHFGKDRRQIYRWLDSYGIPRDSEPE
ncbi:MAG: sigma 54-interacting transcriptional regulator [Pseudomonadota bacterium]